MANDEAKALRERRQTQTRREQARQAEEQTPAAVGASEAPRRRFALGDPSEPRVIPHNGMTSDGIGTGYRVAESDVTEMIYPAGCVTPTVRVRWRRGQRVPTAVYERWQAEQSEPATACDEAVPRSGAPAE